MKTQTIDARFTAAASRPAADAKPIGTTGGILVDTPEGIERMRMIVCLQGLKLEAVGIRVHRGISCLAVARRDYGITAKTAAAAYDRLRAKLEDLGIIGSAKGGAR